MTGGVFRSRYPSYPLSQRAWCHRNQEGGMYSTGLGREHSSATTEVLFKRENVLLSCIKLGGLDCVLGKAAPRALLDPISSHKCAVISRLSPVPLSSQEKKLPYNEAWRG